MNGYLSHPPTSYSEEPYQPERRGKPRIKCSYPAVLRVHPGAGLRYEARAVLANMSAAGMYLRLKRLVPPGEPVFIMVRLSTAPLGEMAAPQIAASGIVTRAELLPDGTYGVAVKLHHHRFL
ncbi:MAG: PilZ domain-containing protein [Chloroflexota bacterium]